MTKKAKAEIVLEPEQVPEQAPEQLVQVILPKSIEKIAAPKTYEECLQQVGSLMRNAEVTLVMTSWIIGKIVNDAAENASYGDGVVGRLSDDIGKSKSLLYDMKRLYEYYPTKEALQIADGVNWSAIRQINTLSDADVRSDLYEKARDEKLTTNEVKELVEMAHRAADGGDEEPETPDPPEEPDNNEGPNDAALRYFRKIESTLAAFQEDVTEIIAKLPEMKLLATDEDGTTEEDYEVILDVGRDISVKSRAIAEFITLHLHPLNNADAFDEGEE